VSGVHNAGRLRGMLIGPKGHRRGSSTISAWAVLGRSTIRRMTLAQPHGWLWSNLPDLTSNGAGHPSKHRTCDVRACRAPKSHGALADWTRGFALREGSLVRSCRPGGAATTGHLGSWGRFYCSARTADHMLRMARYIERARETARHAGTVNSHGPLHAFQQRAARRFGWRAIAWHSRRLAGPAFDARFSNA